MADYRENVLPVLNNSILSEQFNARNTRNVIELIRQNELLSVQKSGCLQDFISKTHGYLTSSQDRLTGLVLLNQLVQQCNTEIFQQHSPTWFRLLLQVLQSHASSTVYRVVCDLISTILQVSRHFTDLSRDIVSTTIPQLVPLLLIASSEWKGAALRCVTTCLQTFPGPMATFRNKIESLVLHELEEHGCHKEAVDCLCHLVRCGGGGNQGNRHTDNWTDVCDRLTGSLHETLTVLYEGLETGSSLERAGPTLALKPLLSSEQNRLCQYVCRWTVLCNCLQTLLGTEFHAVAKIPADVIIKMICRCLSINRKMLLSRPTAERTSLALQLPSIHTGALMILKQLILCCGTLLVPYCRVLMGYLSQELLWTHWSETQGNSKPYGALRSCVYEVLCIWLKVMDGCSGFQHEEKVILTEILHDITPEKQVLKIEQKTTTSSSDGPAVKKKHKGGNYEVSQGISSQRKIHSDANKRLVETGLEALYWIVTTVGPELERKSVQNIQEFTVRTVPLVQQSGVQPIPYGGPECRKQLYRVLQGCAVTPHPTAPPIIQCAVRCLSAGLQDRHIEVSSFCLEALRICEVLIHPRVPCLNGPIVCENLVYIGDKESAGHRVPGKIHSNDLKSINGHVPDVTLDFNPVLIRNTPSASEQTNSVDYSLINFKDHLATDERRGVDSVIYIQNNKRKGSESLPDLKETSNKRGINHEDDDGPSDPKYTKIKETDNVVGIRNLPDNVTPGKTVGNLDSGDNLIELDDSSSDSSTVLKGVSEQVQFSTKSAAELKSTADSPQPSTSKAGAIEIATDNDSSSASISIEEIGDDGLEEMVLDSVNTEMHVNKETRTNAGDLKDVNGEVELEDSFITTDSQGNKEVLIAVPITELSSDEDDVIAKDLQKHSSLDNANDNKRPSPDVEAMLMTFVDAAPDPE